MGAASPPPSSRESQHVLGRCEAELPELDGAIDDFMSSDVDHNLELPGSGDARDDPMLPDADLILERPEHVDDPLLPVAVAVYNRYVAQWWRSRRQMAGQIAAHGQKRPPLRFRGK